MIKEIINHILAPGERSAAYLLLALPLLLIALIGSQYGAAALYAVPAIICILQFFRPTFIGWLFVFLPCAGMTLVWSGGLLIDIIKIMTKQHPSILLDSNDSIVFIIALAVFVGLSIWLWSVRPKLKINA